jgi:hypothetical protein
MVMKRYADDYETVVTTDENGEERKVAVYHGAYFEFALDEEGLTHFRRNCFLLLAAIIILHVSSGFVGNRGMYQFYVALPYVLAFFPLLYMAASILRLPKEKRKFRRDEIGLSFDRMRTSSILLVIFLGIGLLGEIVFLLFIPAENQRALEYLYLGLEAFAATAVYFFIRMQRQIRVLTCSEE